MKYKPPVEERSDEELIEIANSTTEYWQKEIMDLARKELDRRGVSREYERKLVERWSKTAENFELRRQEWLAKNATEKYEPKDLLIIAFLAPLILIGKFDYGDPLSDLKITHYRLKYRQRLVCLILGVVFWAVLFIRSLDV